MWPLKSSLVLKSMALDFTENQIPPTQRVCQWNQITTISGIWRSLMLQNTPLLKEGCAWVNANMIDQAAGSNDCAVFLLLTFGKAYLLAMRDAPGGNIEVPEPFSRIQISNRRLSAA